jgi:hypothetical protein
VPGTDAFRVKSHAQAATPHAVAGLDESCEVTPALRREHPSSERHAGNVTEGPNRAWFTARAVTRTASDQLAATARDPATNGGEHQLPSYDELSNQ